MGQGARQEECMDRKRGFALTAIAAVAFAACTPAASTAPASQNAATNAPSVLASSGGASQPAPSSSATSSAAAASVRLQLQWAPQAQFAGYFAAEKQGYFAAENLTVTVVPGGPDVVPQVEGSKPDGPEFTISWVPKVLEAREGGSDLIDIAQIFQRSGTLSVTWKDTNLDDPCKLAGKKVGTWGFGNEYEVTAGLLTCGLTPGLENNGKPDAQYQQVTQAFDMKAFLAREIDAAEAMIYNEYAQVLEAADPATGELYKPEQLNVIDWNEYRVAMLQDAIFVRKAWLNTATNRDVAVRFVRASLRGWIYCRDHPDDCVQYTTDAGSQLGTGHQKWMMNEVNALIWPSADGVGMIDPVFWGQTVKIAKSGGIIKNDPSIEAYQTDIVTEALAGITDDAKGEGFKKATIEVTPGGQ
ncbi:MAG: NitT/TauT family transport system substrate-binding protein [Chloroflexota bacterium]|nr:NitT/TauT family transport system substrate-binding protein [Chloroflexota bacterium]